MRREISANFPYQHQRVDVFGSYMSYVDVGIKASAHTFLLLHGNPTSSYIWRNIIPYLEPLGRVVAPDLIGMGNSDKPDIDYTFQDHMAYVEEFINKLDLRNIILVVQDWGSAIGFNYANLYRQNVVGIVFFEAITRPITWKDTNLIERFMFKRFRHPRKGEKMIIQKNFFIEKFLPMMAGRKLIRQEMDTYRAPYPLEKHRKPLQVWPTQISINGEPEYTTRIKQSYASYLPISDIPKLMLHVNPGMIIKMKEANEIKNTWKNLETVFLGRGKHFIQEQSPHEIGENVTNWYAQYFISN